MNKDRKKTVIRFLECELREYKTIKAKTRQLERTKESLEKLQSSEAKTQLYNIENTLADYEYQISKIEAGLEMCTTQEREILESKYFQIPEPTHDRNMEHLLYGNRNTYCKTRDSAFEKMAKAYGIRGWNE